MVQLVQRLSQRKIVQWALAYAAAAWVALQVLDMASSGYGWTPTVLRVGFGLALIGFLATIVLAWYHGERGQQKVNGTELLILSLLLVVGGGVLWQSEASRRATAAPAPAPASATPSVANAVVAAHPRSIAVLPFDNRSARPEDAFFADGMHDDMLTQLAKISGLKVISRTSVEKFRDSKLSIKEIAAQLGVQTILEGGVQRGGNQVRINMQLIDAAAEGHLWAETYDRELTAENIFAIQSEVTTAITRALKTQLTAGEKAALQTIPTANLDAWEAYQLGRLRMVNRNNEGLAAAAGYFRKAVALDPRFVLAHVALADAAIMAATYGSMEMTAALAQSEASARKALALDPQSAEAWTSMAAIEEVRGNDAEAERRYLKAIELNPNYVSAHHWYGIFLRDRQRFSEAVVPIAKALELDPLAPTINAVQGSLLLQAGQHEQGLRQMRKVIEIDPSTAIGHLFLAQTLAYTFNQFDEALPLLEKAALLDPDSAGIAMVRVALLNDLGDEAASLRVMQQAKETFPGDSVVAFVDGYLRLLRGELGPAEQAARVRCAAVEAECHVLAQVLGTRGDYPAVVALHRQSLPEAFKPGATVQRSQVASAANLAHALLKTGDPVRAGQILASAEASLKGPRKIGFGIDGIADVRIHAVRGDKAKAIAALRAAYQAGWRGPLWRMARDVDPQLGSIRNEPGFKAVFVELEADMRRQREAIRQQE